MNNLKLIWHTHIQSQDSLVGRENTGGEREDAENEKALASGILGVLAPAVRHLDETVGGELATVSLGTRPFRRVWLTL